MWEVKTIDNKGKFEKIKNKKKLKIYNKKLVKSGNIIELYEYEKPIQEGYENNNSQGRSSVAEEEEQKQNRLRVQQRAKRDLKRIINSNAGQWADGNGEIYSPKFLTLTFKENVTDVKSANKDFDLFKRRLNRYLGYRIKYLVVVEFQKRGAVHYHVVIFNIRYIPVNELAKIWSNGFIKLNKIEEVDNIGAYVSKYMGKGSSDDRLIGEKSYFSSRGLHKPEEIKENSLIEGIIKEIEPYKNFETDFQNEYSGPIKYKQYNLNLKK